MYLNNLYKNYKFVKLYSEKYQTQIFVKWTHFVREMKTQMYDVHILEIYSSAINELISLYVSTDLNCLPQLRLVEIMLPNKLSQVGVGGWIK